jgi:hypothetical protein
MLAQLEGEKISSRRKRCAASASRTGGRRPRLDVVAHDAIQEPQTRHSEPTNAMAAPRKCSTAAFAQANSSRIPAFAARVRA